MLVTGIFSFSHSVFSTHPKKNFFQVRFIFVFCKCFQFGPSKNLSFGKGLKLSSANSFRLEESIFCHLEKGYTLYLTIPIFNGPEKETFVTVCKGESAWNHHFLLLPLWFLLYKFQICQFCCLNVELVCNFVVL